MKTISQVIAKLQALQAEHGDIPFVRYQSATGGTCDDPGHDPEIDLVVEPFAPWDDLNVHKVDGKWVKLPYIYIAEGQPVVACSLR